MRGQKPFFLEPGNEAILGRSIGYLKSTFPSHCNLRNNINYDKCDYIIDAVMYTQPLYNCVAEVELQLSKNVLNRLGRICMSPFHSGGPR